MDGGMRAIRVCMVECSILDLSTLHTARCGIFIFRLLTLPTPKTPHKRTPPNIGQQVLQGKNMLVFRAGNKGAVCLPFRLHQSTLVVAAAHLPADGSRRSKVRKGWFVETVAVREAQWVCRSRGG